MAGEDAPASARAGPGTGSLLVVEDDPQVRAVTVRTLARAGYEVQLATSGAEALAFLREHPSRPLDLLVTDVVMPGMSGSDLATEVQRQRPGLPVLYVSGYSPEFLAERHGIAEGSDLLQKPFTTDALLGRVRQALTLPVA
ncbi:MAG: response regulator [Anaeromyxobacteraceae bacterium]